MSTLIRIQREDFDPQAEADALTKGRPDVGALTTFTGFCRHEEGALSALELEHYPGMAEKELQRIVDEARARWPVQGPARWPSTVRVRSAFTMWITAMAAVLNKAVHWRGWTNCYAAKASQMPRVRSGCTVIRVCWATPSNP